MKDVKIYLKTALFALKARDKEDSIPANTLIIEAEIKEKITGGFILTANKFYSIKHDELKGSPTEMFIPTSKIDHIRILA